MKRTRDIGYIFDIELLCYYNYYKSNIWISKRKLANRDVANVQFALSYNIEKITTYEN